MRGAEAREQGIDLDKVVQRVKAIMLENEELGAMVVEAGKHEGREAEWQKALDGTYHLAPGSTTMSGYWIRP
jgi:hypothetical protein